ncbi:MAG: family 10 glycosylhydrolase [Gemmatimonadetes bacterium]|nr:family 10 glycosylhydrolase [Gemmatimonadota bacterium]
MAEVVGAGQAVRPTVSGNRRLRAGVLVLVGVLASVVARPAVAQDDAPPSRGVPYAPLGGDPSADTIAPPLPREFRAVWVATVTNIDWPSRPGLPVDSQKTELLAILDLAAAVRLNAVIFQVRPGGDALYQSHLEPWSYFLTGQQGRAPQPMWDPLAFAVAEAHKRGMELHAWFNPYRAGHPRDTTGTKSPLHLSRTNPAVVHRYGPYTWMDPGEAVVRRKTIDVVVDVVRRYDVDGVHIDDYFYPYPERTRRGREIPFPDERSWRAYKAREGTLSRDDWRRQNVDQLVQELYTAIKRAKPWVKFGISPFGIWRPGYPESVRGFDAYDRLYADSRKWLNEGWVDYWTPQLYWKLGAPLQSYRDLLAWWRAENRLGRNLWPGNYTSRASARRSAPWPGGRAARPDPRIARAAVAQQRQRPLQHGCLQGRPRFHERATRQRPLCRAGARPAVAVAGQRHPRRPGRRARPAAAHGRVGHHAPRRADGRGPAPRRAPPRRHPTATHAVRPHRVVTGVLHRPERARAALVGHPRPLWRCVVRPRRPRRSANRPPPARHDRCPAVDDRRHRGGSRGAGVAGGRRALELRTPDTP